MITRARRIVAHWHQEAAKYEEEGYPRLAMENRKECQVIEGLLKIIDRPLWRKALDWIRRVEL